MLEGSKTTCDTCDGGSGIVKIRPSLFHLHLFGTLVVVLIEYVHPHVHPVAHDLLGDVFGQVVRDGPATNVVRTHVRGALTVVSVVRRLALVGVTTDRATTAIEARTSDEIHRVPD